MKQKTGGQFKGVDFSILLTSVAEFGGELREER